MCGLGARPSSELPSPGRCASAPCGRRATRGGSRRFLRTRIPAVQHVLRARGPDIGESTRGGWTERPVGALAAPTGLDAGRDVDRRRLRSGGLVLGFRFLARGRGCGLGSPPESFLGSAVGRAPFRRPAVGSGEELLLAVTAGALRQRGALAVGEPRAAASQASLSPGRAFHRAFAGHAEIGVLLRHGLRWPGLWFTVLAEPEGGPAAVEGTHLATLSEAGSHQISADEATPSLMAFRIASTTASGTEPNSGRRRTGRWSAGPTKPSAW